MTWLDWTRHLSNAFGLIPINLDLNSCISQAAMTFWAYFPEMYRNYMEETSNDSKRLKPRHQNIVCYQEMCISCVKFWSVLILQSKLSSKEAAGFAPEQNLPVGAINRRDRDSLCSLCSMFAAVIYKLVSRRPRCKQPYKNHGFHVYRDELMEETYLFSLKHAVLLCINLSCKHKRKIACSSE